MLKIIVFAALLLGAGEARAELVFSSTPCGGPGQNPCTVTQAYRPAVDAAPLTQQSFNAFYQAAGFDYTATYDYAVAGSNADYAFGPVENDVDGFFHTYFVDGPNGIICCTIDYPWALAGINASGFMIGRPMMSGTPFISSIAALIDSGYWGEAPPLPFSVINGEVGYDDRFLAIDNDNNILAQRGDDGSLYELRPVPTPGTVWMLGAGLLAIATIRRFSAPQRARPGRSTRHRSLS
jgi:hypothetical protein